MIVPPRWCPAVGPIMPVNDVVVSRVHVPFTIARFRIRTRL